MRNAFGKLRPGPFAAKKIAIGAGGWCKSVDASDDGTLILGNDTGPGPKILRPDSDTWIEGFRAGDTISASEVSRPWPEETGAVGVAISATDSNRMACMCMGKGWTSTNGGRNWTLRPGLTHSWIGNDRSTNGAQAKLVIDPNNPNVIYACSNTLGLLRSLDFGVTFAQIASVPPPASGQRMAVAVHRQGPLVSGRSANVVVVSGGVGTYISSDGGNTFAVSSGGPTDVLSLIYTAGGQILVSPEFDNPVFPSRFDGTSWSPLSFRVSYFVAHPTLNTVWSIREGAGFRASTDGGATWSANSSGIPRRVANSIGWHAWTNEDNFTGGYMCWSPRWNGISIVQGIGHWYYPTPGTSYAGVNRTLPVYEFSKGIENMVVPHLDIVKTDGDIIFGMHDRTGMQLPRATCTTQYPANHFGTTQFPIIHGSNADYAIDDPNWRAVIASGGFQYTPDRWLTRFDGSGVTGAFQGGNLVVRDKGEAWLISPTVRRPKFTLDYGATWNDCDFGPAANPFMGNVGNYNNYYLHRRVLRVCKITGTVYFYCVGGSAGTNEYINCAGVWRLRRGETVFTRIRTSLISEIERNEFGALIGINPAYGNDYWNGHLSLTPDRVDHVWWAAGDSSSVSHVCFSRDGGATFSTVGQNSTLLSVNPMLYPMSVGFGKPVEGTSYPTIYVVCDPAKLRAKATSEGLSPPVVPHVFMIQDFDPFNPNGATIEPLIFEGGVPYPDGNWDYVTMCDGWTTNNDLAVSYTTCGALLLEYSDKARAT